jgi:hypothetical protein
MTESKKRGGKRAGAGRKPVDGIKKPQLTIKLPTGFLESLKSIYSTRSHKKSLSEFTSILGIIIDGYLAGDYGLKTKVNRISKKSWKQAQTQITIRVAQDSLDKLNNISKELSAPKNKIVYAILFKRRENFLGQIFKDNEIEQAIDDYKDYFEL